MQEQYDEAPPDFARIYNVTPLYKGKKPITGKGQTVVVLETSDVNPADVARFRSAFGLSSFPAHSYKSTRDLVARIRAGMGRRERRLWMPSGAEPWRPMRLSK